MKKDINEILTTKKQKFIVGATVMLLLIAVGLFSYAFTGDISYFGLNTNKISICGIDISFKDSNPIRLLAGYPMDYQTAKKYDPYTFYLKNNGKDCISLVYQVSMDNICDTCEGESCSLDDGSICNCSEEYQIDDSLINYELKNVSSGKIITGEGIENLSEKYALKSNETDQFEMRIWISEKAENNDVYVNGDNKVPKNYCGKLKINVIESDEVIEDDNNNNGEIIKRNPNAPELASNMIPVTYNGTQWVKANSKNLNKSWYDYDSKKWANAVTVTSANRSTYLSAPAGTPISMDDINTMWVWIPRFSAKRGGQLCSTIEEPSVLNNINCYMDDEEIEDVAFALLIMIETDFGENSFDPELLDSEEFQMQYQMISMGLKSMIQTPEYMESEFDDPSEIQYLFQIYTMYYTFRFLSEFVDLSEEDLNTVYSIAEQMPTEEERINAINGIELYLKLNMEYMILQQIASAGGTVTSQINADIDDFVPMCKVMSESSEEVSYDSCIEEANQFVQANNETKLQFLLSEEVEYILSLFLTYPEIMFDFEEDHYHIVNNNGAGSFDVSFVDTRTAAHEAFTFGEEELGGIWVAKFEPSHPTLSDDSSSNNLNCTDEMCENAKEIEILPNKKSLRYNDIKNFFYAGRSMEQTENNYGLVSSEIDTHMMKNSEWGAVVYLTQSVYGRCTTLTNCTEVGINNKLVTTGYGAPAGSDIEENDDAYVYVEPQYYDTIQGMDASTTGNIYGIYDMSGSSGEWVMGLNVNSEESYTYSGFSSSSELPNSMYYNSYQYTEDYVLMGLQHAVLETAGWYNDSMRFFDGGGGWFMRGFGISLVEDFPIITGIFSVGDGDAGPNMFGTFRPVLVK